MTVLEKAFATQRSVPSNAIASENEFSGQRAGRGSQPRVCGSIFVTVLTFGVRDPDEPAVEGDAVRARRRSGARRSR